MKIRGPSTRSVHLPVHDPGPGRSVVPPIFQNSAYGFEDLDTWRAVALGEAPGDIYSRNTNPTVRRFEERMAALEGAEAATSFATGMAAITTTLLALLDPSRRAVTIRDAYGATYLLFSRLLPRWELECAICETDDHEALEQAIADGCDLLYLESPTNPRLKVLDLRRLAARARDAGAVVVVDNTFATPLNQSPLCLGAHLVIHSATKYLGGHSDVLGGVVCGDEELVERVFRYRELTGPSLDANSAFLLLRSLKTLALRVERQNANALVLARFLAGHSKVERVLYPGLEDHPGHHVARRQMSGFGGVLAFEVTGGMEAASRLLPRLELAYMAANLGQVETIVGPASLTSHVELSEEEREASGVPASLIRYAVGIEDVEDLQADLDRALGSL